jgi:DNA-binding transcriptional ArsR family regulator
MANITIKSLESLFISKVRLKALKYFLLNPEKEIHLRGAVREFQEEINAVRRELTRLEEAKIIKVEAKGNRRYFELNGEHPFINEFLSLFHKSYGLGAEILNNIRKLGDIEFAFITPAFTKNFYYGSQVIDLVVVGTVDLKALEEAVQRAQIEMSREIHYMVMKSSEFQLRKRRKDQFIMDLMVQDNIMLIGTKEDFIR